MITADNNPSIETFVTEFRDAIEPLWTPETAAFAPDLYPQGYDLPPSAGQSVPTSIALLGELRANYPDKAFTLGVGAVVIGSTVALRHHSFVRQHPVEGREPLVIDPTSDQIPGITERIIVAGDLTLAKRDIHYHLFTEFVAPPEWPCADVPSDIRETKPNSRQRAAQLREALGDWRSGFFPSEP